MKILYVITSLRTGGAEHLVAEMTKRFIQKGHKVDVCVFDGTETVYSEQVRKSGGRIIALSHKKSYYNPLYIWRLAKIMRNYDIVHTHNSSPQLFVAIARMLCSVKLVSTEHTTSNRKRGWKWYRPIESWMYKQYDHIVCISKIAEEKLREYMGGKWLDKNSTVYRRISTINNGVDVDAINKANPDKELLSMKGNKTAILMVAGFRDAKDQDSVVKAMSLLDKDKFEVWFAGMGVRMEQVKMLATKMGVDNNVRFLGLRSDVPNVIKAADIVVMSSHWEGLSLSNIEGMSAGKPFIASNVNGLKEVTEGWGLLFEHENAKQLADIIQHLASNPEYYQQISARCYQRALHFDINKMVEGYEKVYLSVVTQ